MGVYSTRLLSEFRIIGRCRFESGHARHFSKMQTIRIKQTGPLDGGDAQIEWICSWANEIYIPSDTEDLSAWWELARNGVRVAYVGTPETFERWQKEEEVLVVWD